MSKVCFFRPFPSWHGNSASVSVHRLIERLMSVLGSFEMQLLDPSCQCFLILQPLQNASRAVSVRCYLGSYISLSRLVRFFRILDVRDGFGPSPIFR